VRDKLGRHDGDLHGGKWHSSPLALLDVSDLKQMALKEDHELAAISQVHSGNI
jgi:hypothetical protein